MGAGYQLPVSPYTQHLQLFSPPQKYPSQVLGTADLAAKAKSKSQRSLGSISQQYLFVTGYPAFPPSLPPVSPTSIKSFLWLDACKAVDRLLPDF